MGEVSGARTGGASPEGAADITLLLRRARDGDGVAEDALFRLVYEELHRQAAAWMRRQPKNHTLQATALVHEVFLKVARRDASWNDRTHFFSTAARAMRQILVDHARGKHRRKRGGDAVRRPIDAVLLAYEDRAHDVLALDESLTALAAFDAQAASIVELKFFAGLTNAEVAERLGISLRTVERDWESARAWLADRLGEP